jgi:DNA-binding LacI/PurR family transcriptional regulator
MMKETILIETPEAGKTAAPATLKSVAECVGLAVGTISAILNETPQSLAIPEQTRTRVFAAARKLRYQPNPFARALRSRRVGGQPAQASGSRVLVFKGPEQFMRAVDAMRQAGMNVPGDVAVVAAEDYLGPSVNQLQ